MTKITRTSEKITCYKVLATPVTAHLCLRYIGKSPHGARAAPVRSTRSEPFMCAMGPPWHPYQRCQRSSAVWRALLSTSTCLSSSGERRRSVVHGSLFRWQGRVRGSARPAAVIACLSKVLYPYSIRLSVQVDRSTSTAFLVKKGGHGGEGVLALALKDEITKNERLDAADKHGGLNHAAEIIRDAPPAAARRISLREGRWQRYCRRPPGSQSQVRTIATTLWSDRTSV